MRERAIYFSFGLSFSFAFENIKGSQLAKFRTSKTYFIVKWILCIFEKLS